MKKYVKILSSLLCAAIFAVPVFFTGCSEESGKGSGNQGEQGGQSGEFIDYAGQLHLDMASSTKKLEVTVRTFIDGDTTHFDPVTNSTLTPDYNPQDFSETQGYIKARYLAVNTPESTGDVEKWGKTASNFTHEKLENASIIVESDNDKWNMDSNNRFTLWIWYKSPGASEYRNLNIELLQYGYGRAQSAKDNRYGDIAMDAIMQAQAQKLRVYSNDPDENFYEGEAFNMTLKKLRCHIDDYLQKSVRVEGVVTTQMDNSVYIEDYDEETGLSYGISIYYGYNPGSSLRKVLAIGNRISVCGTVGYFEAGGTYQISGVSNNAFHPEYTTNTVIVKDEKTGEDITGQEGRFAELSVKDIVSGDLTVPFGDDEEVSIKYGEAILDTTVCLKNLKVNSVSTTSNGGENDGAMSLRCSAPDGSTITVRTTVFKENGILVTKERYEGKTIDVKGVIEKFSGNYQVKVHLMDYITIHA